MRADPVAFEPSSQKRQHDMKSSPEVVTHLGDFHAAKHSVHDMVGNLSPWVRSHVDGYRQACWARNRRWLRSLECAVLAAMSTGQGEASAGL